MTLNWTTISNYVTEGVTILAPIAEAAVPEAAAGIAIADKIIAGLIAAEPTAVALVEQIQAGTPPTQTQMSEYYANYQADDDALNADIAAHLAALKTA